MSEIEKMYENFGIKPTKNWQSCLNCKLKTEIRYDDWGREYLTCNRRESPKECPNAKEYYPIFTAEKQLGLMAFLINRKVGLSFKAEQGEITVEAISRGLAGIVNKIWQDLTELEKQQVKGILE